MGFIHDAIRFQDEATSLQQANRRFNISCRICAEHGLITVDCDRCPVNAAHSSKVEYFKLLRPQPVITVGARTCRFVKAFP